MQLTGKTTKYKDGQIVKYAGIISNIKKDDNLSLIFSNNKINHPKMKFYKVSKDISLENIVNIVLFNLY